MKLIAVDPWNCGCTECIIGEYVPLRMATDDQIADLIAGRLRSNLNSGTELEITITHMFIDGHLSVASVTVRYEHYDGDSKEWSPDPYRCGLAK